MTEPSYRRTILMATVLLAAIAPRVAEGQAPTQQPLLDKIAIPNPLSLPDDLMYLGFDELRLRYRRAQLQADLERGDPVRINRDLNKIRVDERLQWRHRRNAQRDSFQQRDPWVPAAPRIPLGTGLVPDPQSPGYGFHPAEPTQLYRLPASMASPAVATASPAPAPVFAELRNSGAAGTAVNYEVDGVTYRIDGGAARKVAVGPSSIIRYDRGNGLGIQGYALRGGGYEFRSGAGGLALFRLPSTP